MVGTSPTSLPARVAARQADFIAAIVSICCKVLSRDYGFGFGGILGVAFLGGWLFLSGGAASSAVPGAGSGSGNFQLSTIREKSGSMRVSDSGAHFKPAE